MKTPLLLIALLLIACAASALPTTQPGTNIGNNNFTFTGTGVTGTTGWFQWGMAQGQSWAHTPNRTSSAGTITYTMKGTPIFGCTTYYYRACDPTGCGAELSFMTLAVTPIPTVTYGAYAQNITENQGDPSNAFWNFMQPYMGITGSEIFYGLIFACVFVGIWLRTRGTAVANIFGMICVGLFASSAVGLQLGLPPEFVAVGQALMYLSLTGAVMAFTFK